MPNRTEILVDVESAPAPNYAEIKGKVLEQQQQQQQQQQSQHQAPSKSALNILPADPDARIHSYQNQTAEDIASGRARIDSVGSFTSGGSEEALLVDGGGARPKVTSPRRGRGGGGPPRENAPLLSSHRSRSYEEVEDEDEDNTWPGKETYFSKEF